MPDREKVVALLERYVRIPNLAGAENYGAKIVDMPAPLITDALALLKAHEQNCRECGEATSKAIQELQTKLKAQEPGKVNITNSDSDGWKEGNCPFCGMKLDSFYNWSFCGTCGRAVKWE